MGSEPLSALFLEAKKANVAFGQHAVFDVGANKGRTYLRLRKLLPEAQIHCFEPAPSTFSKLEETIGGDTGTLARRVALASKNGNIWFTADLGTGNHIIPRDAEPKDNVVEVNVVTGDHYCQQMDIEEIDFLKIDTEGFDLDVCLGFADMLRQRRISYLQVECSTNLDNRYHVHLERFIHFLHPFNYRLHSLIEPVRKVYKTRQNLHGMWFCNAIFAREVETPKLRRDGFN